MTGWQGLRGRRVGVWGTGVEGQATLRRLAADGISPHAQVDGDDGIDALASCDVVVKSPGISPYDEPARSLVGRGVELTGGLALWLEDAPRDRVLCVTGTKGKSTTASIAGALATGLGARCLTGGNIGVPPWDPEAPEVDWWVIETSSHQAYDLRVGPRVVVVTSLGQDHLVWHHGEDAYVRDKLSLCTRPGVEVVLVPADDAAIEAQSGLLGGAVRRVPDSEAPWVDALGLLGDHNRRNALLARAALTDLGVPGADDDGRVAAAAAAYEPLRSRLTHVGSVGGVDFVDDSLSTNVLPTLAAVASFPGRRVALLVGGQDRGIDYAPLAHGLAGRADLLVVTMPDNGPRIAAALAAHASGIEVLTSQDLSSAVEVAYAWAAPGGVVLLSPAAPSFDRFRDYADRADQFEAAMRGLS
jgi:UDP-N-acetylmuramoylalanine--D-glutamate ligase